MAKSNEPLIWSLFAGGGMVSALFVPVLILFTGIGLPLAWFSSEIFSYDRMIQAVSHPIVKISLLVLISLPLFHAGPPLRFALVDMGLRKFGPVLSLLCYGGAIVGTIFTIVVLLRF